MSWLLRWRQYRGRSRACVLETGPPAPSRMGRRRLPASFPVQSALSAACRKRGLQEPKRIRVRYTEIKDERADKNRLSPNAIRQRPEQRNQQGETGETD